MRSSQRAGRLIEPIGAQRWYRRLSARSSSTTADGVVPAYLRPGAVSRPTLERPSIVARMVDTSARVVLVLGPAGAGKSTLICEWASHWEGDRLGWLAVHRAHSSPVRFWQGLVAALSVAVPEARIPLPRHQLGRLTDEETDIERVAAAVADIGEPIALVIDDLHVLTNDHVVRQFQQFLESVPPDLRLVIGSRSHPPLRVSRGRALGELATITFRDLAFSEHEVGLVLEPVLGRGAARLGRRLHRATDGWPVLVTLAASASGSIAGLEDLLDRDLTSSRWLADYVVDELLDAHDEATRSFFLETSILGHFSGDLCDAVRRRGDSAGFIDRLEQSSLLIGQDARGEWWRHHHLVRELIERRATLEIHDLAELHTRAAEWYADHQMHADAVQHALTARRYDIVIDQVLPAMRLFQVTPGDETRWFDEVPDDVFLEAPDTLGEIALYVRIVGTPEQRERLETLVTRMGGRRVGPASAVVVDDEIVYQPEIDWQVVLGGDVPAAIDSLNRLLDADVSELWGRFVPGLAVMGNFAGDDVAKASAVALSAVATARDGIFRRTMVGFAAAMAHHLGDTDRADEAIEPYRDTSQGTVADLSVEWALALSAQRHGDRDGTKHHFELARYWTGDASWPRFVLDIDRCESLARLGERDEALHRLVDVRRRIRVLADPGALTTRAERIGRLLGEDVIETDPRRASGRRAGLTMRELDVLVALDSERSIGEVARSLFVSANTVKSHTRSIYRKAGVTSRAELRRVLADWSRRPLS